ncbi:LacI family DNA-binding transcriptional regulator [Alloscardovia macacae]|uniref:LacI family transcriptional regulator n=2 Tax=Alloscardovia macacae TaxID=1160091 RepID=A0A261F419_9BIFI|nr:LacI family transcriptional regulator [Alloscardovia macacae]
MVRKKATITDVARESGVSISTVSYVMNGKRSISEETCEKVLEVARRLHYVPRDKVLAQELGLLPGRKHAPTKVIALSSPVHRYTDYTNYASFFFALAQRARRRGYDILLLMHEKGDEELIRVVDRHMVDGILLLDVLLEDSRADVAKELSLPVVSVGYPINTSGLWAVDLDFAGMGRESIDKLREYGHENVLIIGGIDTAYHDEANYLMRYRDSAIDYARCKGITTQFATLSEYNRESMERTLDDAFSRKNSPTALIWMGSSAGATILMEILHDRKMNVPEDISVLAACTYGVSHLAHPMDEIPMDPSKTCKRAVDVIVDVLEGKRTDKGTVELLPSAYISRGTVGKVVHR